MSSTSVSCERHLEAGRRALSLGDAGTADAEFAAAIADAEHAGADLALLATALGARAQLFYQTKRYADALPLFQRALDVREHAEGADSPTLAPTLHNVAAAHLAMGDSMAAETQLRRALALLESVHGEEHPELSGVLNALSQLCLKRGAHAEAEPLLRRLLSILGARGEERPEVATVMASLASVHHALSEHEAAERLLRRVLDIRERTLAPNHFAIATTLEALAETCATRGKLDEALALLERSLDMRERTQGASHPSLAVVRAKIADLQLQLSQDAFSIPLMEPVAEPRHAPPPLALEAPRSGTSLARLSPTPPQGPPRGRPVTEFHPAPGTSGGSTFANRDRAEDARFDAVRHLAADLNGGPGARDMAFADRPSDSDLSISILPSGGALVLPGAERPQPVDPGELLDEDDFQSDDWSTAPRAASLLANPMVRFGVGAAVLALVAIPAALALKSDDGGDELASSVSVSTSPTGTARQSIAGSVVLPAALDGDAGLVPSGDSTAETSEQPRSGSPGRAGSPSGEPRTESRTEQRSGGQNRPQANERRSSEGSEPASVPVPSADRLIGRVDVRVDATVPNVSIGGTVPESRDAFDVAGSRARETNPYGGARGYRPAALIGDVPAPRYPSELRRQRLKGEVLVTFTVDTNGRVDANTFRVLRATDMGFVASVSELLPQLRFIPAERDGTKVPQVVQMPFRFDPPRD